MAVGMQIAPGCWSGMILIYYHTHKKENRLVRMLHKSDSNLFCTHVFLAKGKNVSTHILVNEERCPVPFWSRFRCQAFDYRLLW